MTLLEVMIAMGLLSMLSMGVAFIGTTAARQWLALYGDSRTLHRAHLVLDRVRYKMMMGQLGQVQILDSGHTIKFRNPNNAVGVLSMFKFMDGKVFWYENETLAASTPGQGIGEVTDLTFQLLGAGEAVRVVVVTKESYSWRLARPFTLDTQVTLRN